MHHAPGFPPRHARTSAPMHNTKRKVPHIVRQLQAPAVLGLLALLSACAGQGPESDMQIPIAQE